MNSRTKRAQRLLPGLVVGLGATLVAGGCIEREGRPVNPCTQVTVSQKIQVNNVDKVDLLFMVDNSNSMAEEQASLAAQFPDMIRILTSGDFNLDGDTMDDEDFDPVKDLNVGIVTSDMGTGGFSVPTCARADFGDDGIMRTQGRTDMGCNATYPNVLNYRPGGGVTPDSFATDVSCVAVVGTGGCGFESQLEAPLKALTPTTAQPWTATPFVPVGTPGAPLGLERPFFGRSSPHGNVENDGFARPNSVLAIVLVTDEEDCSTFDPDIYNTASSVYTGDLNLRCFQYGDTAVHPVDRYVNGFLQLRERPGLLIYAPITGIPVDLAPGPGELPNWEALVGDPSVRDSRMVEQVDPSMPNRLLPSCNVPGRGVAFPPVRIVETARRLHDRGAGVTVQSICQSDFSNALLEIIRQIKSALGAACLPRQLNVEADGSVNCDVVSVMPPGTGCDAIPGATAKLDESGNPVIEGDRQLCVVEQLVPTADDHAAGRAPTGSGWYYDNYTADVRTNCPADALQRIGFTNEAQPPSGAEVRLECFLAVQGTGSDDIQIGTFCDPSPDAPVELNRCPSGQSPEGNTALGCDPVSRACGVPCGSDADCRAAGLIGYVCDDRPLNEVSNDFTDTTPHNFCVNPTCG